MSAIGQLNKGDFVAGVSSPISLEPRNISGSWLQFYGTGESQRFSWGDPQGCVSFSVIHHSVAVQLDWALTNNLIPQPTLDFFNANGYIVNGKFNLSERFQIVKSGTTLQGNSFQNVAQSVRNCGIVPEAICPNSTPTTYNEYMSVSDQATQLGLQSLKYLNFSWQSVPLSSVNQYLVQAPMIYFVPVCGGWNTENPIQACAQPVQHAVGGYANTNPNYPIYDSYQPFTKNLSPDYPIPYVFQLIVNFIPQALPNAPRFIFNKDMVYGERSNDVLQLQVRLKIPTNGIYDEATRAAVFLYQLNNLPHSLLAMILDLGGKRVGPRTRQLLNS